MDSNDFKEDSDDVSNSSGSEGVHQTYLWSSYSIQQMRELLRQRGQLTTGNRSTLRKRLKNCEQIPVSATTNSVTPDELSVATVTVAAAGVEAVAKSTSTSYFSISTVESSGEAITMPNIDMDTVEETVVRSTFDDGVDRQTLNDLETKKPRKLSQSIRSRFPKRTNSFSAHFAEFINRRKEALETERQEISVYTSPLTVLSYFVLYILHEFRMALLWIISQQYLLVVLPVIAATVYSVYQTDGAHQPLLKHAESGLIWYGYWTLLGVASSVGLGTGLHTFILFLGPHIAEVTLTAYKCGNTNFDVRGDN
ncbi:Vacuolar membrane protease, partial [Mortierella sp. AD094]